MAQREIGTNRLFRTGLVLAIVLFLAPGLDAQEKGSSSETTPSSSENRSAKTYNGRIEKLLDTLQSDDREAVRRAKKELFETGRRAIPLIRKELKASEGGVYYQLLQQMKTLFSAPVKTGIELDADESILDLLSVEEELHSIERWTKKKEPPKNEQLLIDRYRDALERYKSGETRKALQIAKALLIVSPELSIEKKVKRLIRKCRERMFNENTLRANLTTGKVRYDWEEEITVTYRIKNVSDKSVTLYFEPPSELPAGGAPDQTKSPEGNRQTGSSTGNSSDNGTGQDGKSGSSSGEGGNGSPDKRDQTRKVDASDRTSSSNKIVVEIKEEKIGLNGNRVTETHYRDVGVPARLAIPPGTSWVKNVKFDRSEFEHRYVLRRFTLGARAIPSLMKVGERPVGRWIYFRKASFELYPRGMRESLPATVEKIKRHLRSGNLRDVFFQTFLLGNSNKKELVTFYLTVLPFLKRGPARTIMFLLQELTGKNFYFDRDQWLEWGRNKYDVDVQPPKKKDSNPIPNFTK